VMATEEFEKNAYGFMEASNIVIGPALKCPMKPVSITLKGKPNLIVNISLGFLLHQGLLHGLSTRRVDQV
jgi:hypothetical protein